MPRIRTIKPDFWTDEKVVELDPWARLLFIGLWNFADDQGYIEYSPRRIKMQIFPGDTTDVSPLLASLLEAGLLAAFDSPIGRLLHIQSWSKHQKVSNAASPRVDPSDLVRINLSDTDPPEPSRALCTEEEGNRREEERKGTPAAKAVSNSLAREGARDEPPGTPGPVEEILAEWIDGLPRKPQRQIVNAIGTIVAAALSGDGDQQDPNDVRKALALWQQRQTTGRGVGPQVLISIIHEVATSRPGTDLARASPNNVIALNGPRPQSANEASVNGWLSMSMPPEEAFG